MKLTHNGILAYPSVLPNVSSLKLLITFRLNLVLRAVQSRVVYVQAKYWFLSLRYKANFT